MPDFMKVKIITRDITDFPHRDLEQVPLQTEVQVHWGDKPVPKGYVTMLDLGYQRMDFDGGLDMDGFSATSAAKEHEPPKLEPTERKPTRHAARKDALRKTARKKSRRAQRPKRNVSAG